ncbi:MAG: TIGR03936 family radical SAM-associated protein [Anaerolineales bacterium]|nr:TIGR03936 family radical SAM-associated protein [Anaerolineales bacterium]
MIDQINPVMRIRLTFAKLEAMQYTSHLDLHRTWERTIRRAGLPLAYSHGFNPRPRINLASALPLGFTSDCELVDIWFESNIPIVDLITALELAAPPGLKIIDAEEIDLNTPKLQKQVISSIYIVTIRESIPDLSTQLQTLLSAGSIPRNRRGKDYDLRTLIEDAQLLTPDSSCYQRISLCLTTQDNATGRPDEVLAALDIPLHTTDIKRTCLTLQDV